MKARINVLATRVAILEVELTACTSEAMRKCLRECILSARRQLREATSQAA